MSQSACLWRLASVEDETPVGLSQVALAAVGAERDVHAGLAQDTFGQGLFGGRRRRFSVDRFVALMCMIDSVLSTEELYLSDENNFRIMGVKLRR